MKKPEKTPDENAAVNLVDVPQEDFERYVIEQKINVGQIKSTIVWFNMLFQQLCFNKDAVIDLVTSGKRSKDDPEVNRVLNGIYAEMTKLETKAVFLNKRYKELTEQVETPD